MRLALSLNYSGAAMSLDLAQMREARLAPKFEAPPKPGKGPKVREKKAK